jgi:tetratricopeptide (TPR) repeat protein
MKKLLLVLLALPIIGFGQTADDYFNKALDYAQNGKSQLAIDNFTECLKIMPDYAYAYYNRGLAYHKLENYKDAIADYTSALKIMPDYAKAYNNRGLAYHKLENYKDAIADFSGALKINPDYALAYYNRGLANKKAGFPYCSDYEKACDLGIKESCKSYSEQCSK